MTNGGILIVEDEAIVAADLSNKLRQLGYDVAGTASGGEEAVAMAEELRPDLLLMDIQLGGVMDGIEAAGLIRKRHDLPVIYLTAYSDAATLDRAKLTGPFGYILKPFEERDLATQIELALYKHRAEEEKKRLESQLRRTQKLETVGTLAGGIAHDFNNILTPLLIHTEMAMMDLSQEDPIRHHLKEVYKAGERARDLVKQILTFSQQGDAGEIPLSVTPIVREAFHLLRSSLPATIEINQDLRAERDVVFADPGRIHQIVMNLCTNASHAMKDEGGVLTVSLKDITLDSPESAGIRGLRPGSYLRLDVDDTGDGIEPSVLERIFDPFFTTKGVGKGTGMGLSLVHGIVEDLGGTVTVESRPGQGSTFHVYLPIHGDAVSNGPAERGDLPAGSEHILLVDDEEAMIQAIQPMLESLGYRVTSRTGSKEAMEVFHENPDRFDLLITDMTMPNMTGDRLAVELMRTRPDIPAILCTGFSEKIDEARAKQLGIRAFLMKPVAMKEMAAKVRKVLDKG